jgi:hypothetical protein
MKKALIAIAVLGQAVAQESEAFRVGSVDVKCDCDKEKKEWKSEQIDPEWTKKLGMIPPNIATPTSNP